MIDKGGGGRLMNKFGEGGLRYKVTKPSGHAVFLPQFVMDIGHNIFKSQ